MDEKSAPGGTHMRQNGTVGSHGTEEIDRKLPFDICDRVGLRDSDEHGACVVDQRIDFSVLLDDMVDRRVDRRLVGNIHFKDLQLSRLIDMP